MSDENPTMVTAADYETYARPYIAALEAELKELREIRDMQWAEIERLRKTFCPLCGKPAVIVGREKSRGTTLIHCDDCMAPLS